MDKKTYFISADLEGVTDVTAWCETEKGKDGYEAASTQMTKEVAAAIMETAKIEIDKKKIVMEPVKAIGEQRVKLKLHKDINAEILLKVEEA